MEIRGDILVLIFIVAMVGIYFWHVVNTYWPSHIFYIGTNKPKEDDLKEMLQKLKDLNDFREAHHLEMTDLDTDEFRILGAKDGTYRNSK